MYNASTRGISVTVKPIFLNEQSDPTNSRYVWAYQIQIANEGTDTVQLVSRFWQITDSTGKVQQVEGEGVVGEQPVLNPGEEFEYTSGVPLETPSGFMTGRYQMQGQQGETFDVEIPTFSLDSPYDSISVH